MAAATEELGPLISNKTAYEVTRPLVHSAIAFIIVDTLIVIAKTYSRLYLAKLRFWWDDFWIIVAWATLMPLCGLALAMPYTEVAWNNEDRIIYNLCVQLSNSSSSTIFRIILVFTVFDG